MNAEENKIVMVADDAPANIQVVNSIPKNTYKVRIATNGAKALQLASATPPPDLILLDVMMPEMLLVLSHLKIVDVSRKTSLTDRINGRFNQVRAATQSRFTVMGETFIASAVSSIDNPPK